MSIHIIFHKQYYNSDYAMDSAALSGRLEGIMAVIKSKPDMYRITRPEPAIDTDILRAHGQGQLKNIKNKPLLYEMAALAAGGAIKAAQTAYEGNHSFAIVRPPGHHASANSCWGFCYFNNMAISLLKLYSEEKIQTAFILDFDLHTGDGNINILENRKDGFRVTILNPDSVDRVNYLNEVERVMDNLTDADILAASAGFDQGIEDWGGLLYPEDYKELGRMMKQTAERLCHGRRFAILEGGYNHEALGTNVDAFCKGFE
ncbi:MAG: histone deacetylase family protein [Thermodesulfobacteriota bacterium]|nr:histone deacetylase family protein [Thermodesulfobacteriota bacterium]